VRILDATASPETVLAKALEHVHAIFSFNR
jgi:hypothetical protein